MVRFATAAAALVAAALSAPSAEAFLPPWHAAAPLPPSLGVERPWPGSCRSDLLIVT